MIKKTYKILFATLLLLFSQNNFSQNSKIEIGLKSGLNLSNLRGKDSITKDFDNLLAYTFAISTKYNISKKVSIYTILQLEKKGYVLNNLNTSDVVGIITPNGTIKHNFTYLTMPILGRVTFGKKLQFYFEGGIFTSILLNQTTNLYGFDIPSSWASVNNTSKYKNNDFGLSAGCGLSYPIKTRMNLNIEILNNFGILDIGNTLKTNTTNFLIGIDYKIDNTTN